MYYLLMFLTYAIPVVAVLFFLVSLGLFIAALVRRKRTPGSVSKTAMAVYTTLLTVSAVCLGVLLAVIVGLIALLYTAVAFM